ncbi:MAG: hypothetical protein QOE44_2351 [Solirubrobacteraceae bacterium]|nr:hypothetical protein [Solirubrobacteraceae bacterium]
MSVKTDRLTALLPDAYGATESESLLSRLLDAVAAELMVADDKVKALLKSHWVDYAEDAALDGLGAIYGVDRRRLPDGTPEGDDGLRRRVRSVVPLFTGGGTRRAVTGAVRSALGLPFDLATLDVPPELRDDLEQLVRLDEFPVTDEEVEYGPTRIVVERVAEVGEEAALYVDIVAYAAEVAPARITLTMGSAGLDPSIESIGSSFRVGVRTDPAKPLFLPAGSVVHFETTAAGEFSAALEGFGDVGDRFVGLDGGPPRLPSVPTEPSRWRFAARGAQFDVSGFDAHFDTSPTDDQARFDEMTFDGFFDATPDDGEPFDSPHFAVAMTWTRAQPLVFDLTVPWSAEAAVAAILGRHGYTGKVFVFAGLGQDAVKQVVEQTRAAGVRANLYFSVLAAEDQDVRESFSEGRRLVSEDADATDSLRLARANRMVESLDARDAAGVASDLDIAAFDGSFVFT